MNQKFWEPKNLNEKFVIECKKYWDEFYPDNVNELQKMNINNFEDFKNYMRFQTLFMDDVRYKLLDKKIDNLKDSFTDHLLGLI